MKVTRERLESLIVKEYIFTGADAFPGTRGTQVEARADLHTLTWCVLIVKNGFKVVGMSACVDSAEFDAAKGAELARQDAINKLWPLEGYLLAQHLSGEVPFLVSIHPQECEHDGDERLWRQEQEGQAASDEKG